MNTSTSLVAWLALHDLVLHHPGAVQGFWAEWPSPQKILLSSFDELQCTPEQWDALQPVRALADWPAAERQWARAARARVAIVCRDDPAYPAWLTHIPDPPLLLFVRGNTSALSAVPMIAMVGTRKPSLYGTACAEQLAADLIAAGATIISGLAFGIDRIAHQQSVVVNAPTVAVLASGVDQITPRSHAALADRILASGGAIVSEYPLGTGARDFHFPRRNRLISGMAQTVVIVEGAVQSGTMLTARHAMEQGRPVCAVPGPAGARMSGGPHALIRDGAILVETAAHILEAALPMLAQTGQNSLTCVEALPLMPELWALLAQPCPLDRLIEQSTIDAGALLAHLTTLELAGTIVQTPHGYQRV